jgi:hypothetical protein
MARRRETGSLTPERRAAMLAQLAQIAQLEAQIAKTKRTQMAASWAEGLTDMDMATELGIAENTAIKWRKEGERLREQARDRRGSEDPLRPGEPEPVG